MSKIDKLGFFIDDNARPIVVGLVIVILILIVIFLDRGFVKDK